MSSLFESLRTTPGSTRLSSEDKAANTHGPMSAAAWAHRLSALGVKTVVRELAGLDDMQLMRLARETSAHPTLAAPTSVRLSIGSGIFLAIAGASALAADSFTAQEPSKELMGLAVAAIVLGALVAGLGWMMGLRAVPASRAYGTFIRYVTVIDEQHPWLYQAVEAVQGQTAEAYRERVLATRGPLRGLDLMMMQFAAEAQSELLQCMPARDAVQRIQKLPQVPVRHEPVGPESRLDAAKVDTQTLEGPEHETTG